MTAMLRLILYTSCQHPGCPKRTYTQHSAHTLSDSEMRLMLRQPYIASLLNNLHTRCNTLHVSSQEDPICSVRSTPDSLQTRKAWWVRCSCQQRHSYQLLRAATKSGSRQKRVLKEPGIKIACHKASSSKDTSTRPRAAAHNPSLIPLQLPRCPQQIPLQGPNSNEGTANTRGHTETGGKWASTVQDARHTSLLDIHHNSLSHTTPCGAQQLRRVQHTVGVPHMLWTTTTRTAPTGQYSSTLVRHHRCAPETRSSPAHCQNFTQPHAQQNFAAHNCGALRHNHTHVQAPPYCTIQAGNRPCPAHSHTHSTRKSLAQLPAACDKRAASAQKRAFSARQQQQLLSGRGLPALPARVWALRPSWLVLPCSP
jgi:hypothetical protein